MSPVAGSMKRSVGEIIFVFTKVVRFEPLRNDRSNLGNCPFEFVINYFYKDYSMNQ